MPDRSVGSRRIVVPLRRSLPRLVAAFLCLMLLPAAESDAQPHSSEFRGGPPWWDSRWIHRLPIHAIPNGERYQDVQVRIDLSTDIDPAFSWDPDGRDLRFVHFDTLTNEHSVLSHWLFTDRITHGAWFACCQFNGFMQYHTPAATYYTCLRPKAVRFIGEYDRTYFVYGDFSRDPIIRYFDHDSRTLSDASVPGRTQIPNDAHGNPSLLVDALGYLYVFYGCHGHTIQMRRSLEPESIDAWSNEHVIPTIATYPQPFLLDSEAIVLSYRRMHVHQTHPWTYLTSEDSGETWSEFQDIVLSEGNAIYAVTEMGNEESGRTFHLTCNPFNYETTRYPNIYYMFSDDGLATFKTMEGVNRGPPPFDLPDMDLVYDSDTLSSHVNDIALDGASKPYILFNVGPWDQQGAPGLGEWRFAWHDGEGWTTSVIAPCDHLFDRGCIVIEDGMPFRAYLPVADDLHDGGEVTEYSSLDRGLTWIATDFITQDSEHSHNYVERVRNAHPEYELLWTYGDSNPTGEHLHDEATEVVMHGNNGTIGTLQYGTAHAYVRVPDLDGPTSIYMYYGNAEVSDASNFSEAMEVSYTRLPAGAQDTDLLLEWLMEDGIGTEVADASGHNNDGSIQHNGWTWELGGSTYERRYDVSYPGMVLHLEENSYVLIPEVSGPPEIDQLTIELWFSPYGTRPQSLVTKDLYETDFSLAVPSANIQFYTRAMSLAGGSFYTPTIAAGKWHHVVAVYDGIEMRVYLDGIKSPTVYSQWGAVRWAGTPLCFGRGNLEYFEGSLDEVRLYARALSESEIFAHYRKIKDIDVDIIIGVAPASVADLQGDYIRIGDAIPNPFHGWTRVDYRIAGSRPVTAAVYDVSGRRVRQLLGGGMLQPGLHAVSWDGRNDRGAELGAGVYFLRISAGPDTKKNRLILVK